MNLFAFFSAFLIYDVDSFLVKPIWMTRDISNRGGRRTRNHDGTTNTTTKKSVVFTKAGEDDEASHHNSEEAPSSSWTCLEEIATISSPWLSMYCERLQDDTGKTMDYWRVEKAASCIVITVMEEEEDGRLVLPKPQYRPGIGRATLDFCGGRCDASKPQEAVATILQRELSLDLATDVTSLVPLNKEEEGFIINSSFSNQLLFGYVAHLKKDVKLGSDVLYFDNVKKLLQGPNQLTCLQCRSLLMEWMIQDYFSNNDQDSESSAYNKLFR